MLRAGENAPVNRTAADPVRPGKPSRVSGGVSFRGALADRLVRWAGECRANAVDVLLAGLLWAATFFVHDVGYLLRLPFWTDEAWVAISTKVPLAQTLQVSASTPVGWTLLLRLVFAGGEQRLRIVPLLFASFAVVAAYLYARSLPWPTVALGRLAAVIAGGAALLMRSALVRDDLKQYTADAFVALLILLLASRLEADWSTRRLVGLGVAVVVGFLFSAVSAFVGAAALGGVVLSSIIRRNWSRVRETLAVGGAAAVLLLAIFLLLYRPGIPPGLNDYWRSSYLPVEEGWTASGRFLANRFSNAATSLGMGSPLVAVLLVGAGVAALVRLHRPGLAMVVPVLLIEMIALGALQQYPLFDDRTSHFLTMTLGVTAAIGVGGICVLLARLHVGAALAAASLVAVLFVSSVKDDIRAEVIPGAAEDLRTPADTLATLLRPGDIVVVNMNSNWGFAYYWDRSRAVTVPATSNLQRFIMVFPDESNILVAPDRTPVAVEGIMQRADAAARAARPGVTTRIWFVHQHLIQSERDSYGAQFKSLGYSRTLVVPGLDLLTSNRGG